MIRPFLALAAVALAAAPASAQLSLQQVGTGFNSPLFLTGAPGDANPNQVYVVQKGGLVRTLDTSTGIIGGQFLNLPAVLGAGQLLTGGEQGLLGMAFGPGFNNGNGHVYVDYIGNNGTNQGETRVDRFTVAGGSIVAGSRVNVLTFAQNVTNARNHKAGWIGFGSDNLLYIATGDGGSSNDPAANGQNLGVHLGKILRVAPNTGPGGGYTIPASNPFAASPDPTTQTIFAFGLRNPFRNSFDRANGNLYIADVGQNTREEIDFIVAGSPGGQNFGWRALEGSGDNPGVGDPPPPGAIGPIHDYTHASNGGTASITGGYVYRGGDILDNGQSLNGTYIFGDFVSGRLFSFRYDGITLTDFRDRTAETNSLAVLGGNSLSSFGEDNLGRLYAIDIGGQIYRITGAPIPEPATLTLAGFAAAGGCLRRRRRAA